MTTSRADPLAGVGLEGGGATSEEDPDSSEVVEGDPSEVAGVSIEVDLLEEEEAGGDPSGVEGADLVVTMDSDPKVSEGQSE